MLKAPLRTPVPSTARAVWPPCGVVALVRADGTPAAAVSNATPIATTATQTDDGVEGDVIERLSVRRQDGAFARSRPPSAHDPRMRRQLVAWTPGPEQHLVAGE
jgi:hypothetical protein